VYIHESFGAAQGTRLAQDGDIVDVRGRSEMNGIRAEFPNNEAETWFGPDVSASWSIDGGVAASNHLDPFEPFSPLQVGEFGTVDGDMGLSFDVDGGPARPDALLPFPAPADSASTVSADTVPFVGRTAIGFTSSSATDGNFESDGQAWLELQSPGIQHSGVNTGTWTFHTDGLSGTTLTGTYVLGASNPIYSINRMAVSYDPVAHVAEATVDGVVVASVPYTAQTIEYVGVEGSGSGNVDNFTVRTGSMTDTP
jgi:hypothetical protein